MRNFRYEVTWPDRVKATKKRWRDKNKAKVKLWNSRRKRVYTGHTRTPEQTDAARRWMNRQCRELGNTYVRQLLREGGNPNPTAKQVENKRRFIRAIRAQKTLALLNYATGNRK